MFLEAFFRHFVLNMKEETKGWWKREHWVERSLAGRGRELDLPSLSLVPCSVHHTIQHLKIHQWFKEKYPWGWMEHSENTQSLMQDSVYPQWGKRKGGRGLSEDFAHMDREQLISPDKPPEEMDGWVVLEICCLLVCPSSSLIDLGLSYSCQPLGLGFCLFYNSG